jgi:glycosyltransferase involved in cell wall biosynthesis
MTSGRRRPRVLVVHNEYVSALPSGENETVSELIGAVRAAGVDVRTYIRSSDEISEMGLPQRLGVMVRPIYSPTDVHRIRGEVERFRPDIVQIHNPYPLISPAVVRVAQHADIPVLNYVHNYRHVCMRGTFYRDGHDCTSCAGRSVPWPALVHGCYRESRAQSSVMAVALSAHRRTWRGVDRFVVLSQHVADYLTSFGIPSSRVTVNPNAVPDPGPARPLGKGFLFAGRLEDNKGISLLLESWRQASLAPPARLVIAGDGPRRAEVERAAQATAGVEYLGPLSKQAVGEAIREAAVVVVPSTWQEPFGRTAIEGLAHGRPVLATSVGGLAEIVGPDVGWLVKPDARSLSAGLTKAAGAGDLEQRGRAARAKYEVEFVRDRQVSRLLQVYDDLSPDRTDPVPPRSGRR